MARSDRSLSYGNLPTDGSHRQLSYANTENNVDATATPLVSPLAAVSTTVAVVLNVPNNCAAVRLSSTTALRVSYDNFISYFVLPANTPETFNCGGTNQTLYLKSDASAGNVSFGFFAI
jgi:hypothetical protein